MKKYHRLTNAYDAWWFIYNHPKFMVMERIEVTPEEADALAERGFLTTKDTGGKCYRMYRHLMRHALDEGLEIFYTKTNKSGGHGTVDDDDSKNKYVECWLEFGPVEYGYIYSGGPEPSGDWDTETMRHNYHDIDLDTGGSTFDEALVNLAKNVFKKYGDYKDNPDRESKCGKPVCADCKQYKDTAKKIGLKD